MATTLALTEELAKKQASYDALTSDIQKLTVAAQDWQNAANSVKIRSAHKNADTADKAYKQSMADSYNAQITAKKTQQQQLLDDMKALRVQMDSAAKANEALANQGISQNALEIQANAQADALKTTAAAQADAIKTTAVSTAEADAQAAKTKQYLIYAGIAVAFIVVAFVLISKMKKLKKK